MIDFYDSVSFSLETRSSKRASFAVLGSVPYAFRLVSICCLVELGANAFHVLPHRAYIIVLFGIVEEAVLMKWTWSIVHTLLLVEHVVFDVGLDTVLLHKAVVFLRTVARVSNLSTCQMSIACSKGAHEWNVCQSVCGIGEQGVVENELILGAYLQIVSRFGLSIVHRILLHAHEGGIGVRLAEGVSLAERFLLLFIICKRDRLFLYLLYLLLFLTQCFLRLFCLWPSFDNSSFRRDVISQIMAGVISIDSGLIALSWAIASST